MEQPPAKPRSFVPSSNVGILESPEDVLTTLTREGKRRWLYPTLSKGKFYYQRLFLGWGLVALFVLLPIVRINGKPAILLDLLHREFTFFGVTFYPTDTIILMLFMIVVILGIIIFTALLGRVWCGWACPQTVYLEFLYRPLERLIEGSENQRKRRDQGPWTFDKVWRKTVKFSLYLLISAFLAHTFVAYFVGWDNLIAWMQEPPTEQWGYFLMMSITTGLVFFDFANFREQMCTIACPYARMQSVLLDRDSLIVSYDPNRGEPRARRSKKKIRMEEEGVIPSQGDCIDCQVCVRTCPTGIDIREGLQMECVACTQCIDACDDIMDRIGKPRGLIRYTSENALEGVSSKILRPRTVLYAGLMIVVSALFIMALTTRGSYDVNIGRAVGDPYTVLPDGRIANRLRFRVRNQTPSATAFTVKIIDPADAELNVVGTWPVRLEPGEMKRVETWILAEASVFTAAQHEARFQITFDDGTTEEATFTLLGPSR